MANLIVRIRMQGQIGIPIAEIPFRKEAIDAVIPLIQSWGICYEGGDTADDSIFGQFAVESGEAFFEVVVPSPE